MRPASPDAPVSEGPSRHPMWTGPRAGKRRGRPLSRSAGRPRRRRRPDPDRTPSRRTDRPVEVDLREQRHRAHWRWRMGRDNGGVGGTHASTDGQVEERLVTRAGGHAPSGVAPRDGLAGAGPSTADPPIGVDREVGWRDSPAAVTTNTNTLGGSSTPRCALGLRGHRRMV
jgi:hypothetical protein